MRRSNGWRRQLSLIASLGALMGLATAGCLGDAPVPAGSGEHDEGAGLKLANSTQNETVVVDTLSVRFVNGRHVEDPVTGLSSDSGSALNYKLPDERLPSGLTITLEWSAEPTGGSSILVENTAFETLASGSSPLAIEPPLGQLGLENGTGEFRLLLWLNDGPVAFVQDMPVAVEITSTY